MHVSIRLALALHLHQSEAIANAAKSFNSWGPGPGHQAIPALHLRTCRNDRICSMVFEFPSSLHCVRVCPP